MNEGDGDGAANDGVDPKPPPGSEYGTGDTRPEYRPKLRYIHIPLFVFWIWVRLPGPQRFSVTWIGVLNQPPAGDGKGFPFTLIDIVHLYFYLFYILIHLSGPQIRDERQFLLEFY